MKHKIKYWLSSNRRQMAKLHDLQRQLQEAWVLQERHKASSRSWRRMFYDERDKYDCAVTQLHRVARERTEERRLRITYEERLAYLNEVYNRERELRLAAEERRDVYLEQLANEEE